MYGKQKHRTFAPHCDGGCGSNTEKILNIEHFEKCFPEACESVPIFPDFLTHHFKVIIYFFSFFLLEKLLSVGGIGTGSLVFVSLLLIFHLFFWCAICKRSQQFASETVSQTPIPAFACFYPHFWENAISTPFRAAAFPPTNSPTVSTVCFVQSTSMSFGCPPKRTWAV